MHVSAERIAIADRAIRQTVEQASVAWQSVPHWEIGDPGRVWVRSDVTRTLDGLTDVAHLHRDADGTEQPFGAVPLELETRCVRFRMTLAQTSSSTPDALLSAVAPRAEALARQIDEQVLTELAGRTAATDWNRKLATDANTDVLLGALLDGREVLEDSGYRAPSCLVAGGPFFRALHRSVDRTVVEDLLAAANVTSLHRSPLLDRSKGGAEMLLLGRRQQIAHGNACSASAGEEPVDLAVAIEPSLEVVGEDATGGIDLAVRVRFAARVKDACGVVVFHSP